MTSEIVKLHVIWAPQSYHDADDETRERFTNGCGPDGWHRQLRPLILVLGFGWSPLAACKIHDWMYSAGHTLEDKDRADRVFLNNMLRIVDDGARFWRPWRRYLAVNYYGAVAQLGGPAFWDGEKLPQLTG